MHALIEISFVVWFFVTPSIPFVISTVSFWTVSIYCPLWKVNEHNFNNFTNISLYFIEKVNGFCRFALFELWTLIPFYLIEN